ncbi:MAG TPA: helix-turn-helix domain-containing protein [Methanoregulaceae archaeon]|nr:helix-turn-helix domain-containing protein [Methanoregulaceae archaeon]HQJ88569.1 helix-turn-helix domain-containing protein [Methanoregulaceae archaeon]
MKSGLRHRLAEKMAGEITLSDSPGRALKKWRLSFEIPQSDLAEALDVSPSVISDYESGRRKSPGTAVVGKIVETILSMDEQNGGRYIERFGRMLFAGLDDEVIHDIHEFGAPVPLRVFAERIDAEPLTGSMDQSLFGYTIVDSLNAILQLSSDEFSRIYGWSTERALIFAGVSNGKSPMVAIRVTPFKPRCVVLQGITPADVHPIVTRLAERDRITLLTTQTALDPLVATLRATAW